MSCRNDFTFGPAVSSCRGGFDFTIEFEDIVLSLVPSSLFVVLSIARLWRLCRAGPLLKDACLRVTKLAVAIAYSTLQLSILIAGTQLRYETQLSTAARSAAFVSSAFILPLTVLEDRCSKRPSFLLCFYLLFSILFDIVQVRTRWLEFAELGKSELLARLLTAAVALKFALLVLESRRKAATPGSSPEETAGPFSLATYSWLNSLFFKSYHRVLSLDDLYSLNAQITSKGLCERLLIHMAHAHSTQPMPRFGLAKSLARTLLVPLLLGVLPRLALVGFRFCQPFLLNSLLNHLDNSAGQNSAWKNASYGFVGATVFIYSGVAISSAIYWYCHERFISMTRGALVATIYQRLIQLKTVDVSDSAAVTLMSTDIERIRVGLLNMHEFWGSSLEVALASWLLYRQLGVAFVAPLVVVVFSVVCSFVLNRYTGSLQRLWMDKIQTRVAETAQVLSNLKQLKISGLALSIEESTQQLRVDELNASSKFRRLYVSNMAFGFAPMALCPVITFAVTARNIDTSTIFTSLAYLVLLAEPLGVLFGEIPYFLAAFTSLERIQEFLSKDSQSDDRLFVSHGSSTCNAGLKPCSGPSISIENAQIGWSKDITVFQNTSIRVPASGLTMLIGPVGSGKSTLCKALLAEIPFVRGAVNIGAGPDQFKSSFCDQAPYIYNGSIRDNIVGFSRFDKARYREVVEAAMLYPDFVALPQGDGTTVGSGGITLSGGQKQRIGIARALYSDANFCVFDDSLSGLDTNTELQVFSRVFGPDGILRKRQSTVVLAAHNTKYMPLADHIVVLGGDGVISYAGDYAGLDSRGLQQLDEQLHPEAQAERALQQDSIKSQEPSAVEFLAVPESQVTPNNASFLSERDRMMGDATVYHYYLASLGKLSIIAFAVFGMGWGFFYNFGYIWLEFWSKDSSQHHSKAFYIGLYGLWQVAGLASIVLCFWTSYTVMVRTSSSRLHRAALRTVVHAPLSFLTTTDVGVITNLFSQDMTLVDNELPEAITNLAMDIWNALGTAAVIATSSPYLLISYPILVAILYFVQKFYLRTSRQLRLLELEAKSSLYTHFLDTAKGLATIRSFDWAEDSITTAIKLLDKSQKPTYLLAMARRWLLFVLQCVVAVLAIVVVTLATQISSGTAGFTGASLVALMTFGDTLNYIIRWWTQLETSIGAVTRLKSLSDNVPLESFGDETQPIHPEWPAHGDLKITDVSAAYHAPDQQQPTAEQEKQPHLVLKNFSATTAAGEKVAVCGRSGSGKSSIILLLLRMLDPLPSCSQGIVIDGVGLHSIARADVRERIIAMSQDPVFLPGEISLKRQLDPFNLSTIEECHAVLQLVGLEILAPESIGLEMSLRPESLSGGQKQLFSLARTVLRGRARFRGRHSWTQSHRGEKVGGILLLDEVSASVDKQTEQIMHRIIMEEFAAYTIIMVAHHLDMVMDFDTVLVMEQGRVVERGQPKVLVAKENSHFGQLWTAGRNNQT